jgi:D-alanine-D-alanine ligase
MKQPRIGVLFGGLSSEVSISLRTGDAVMTALRSRGHHVVAIYVDRDLDVALRQQPIDVAFLALHGRFGEDGCVQGLLELRAIPYTGSKLLASATALDKTRAKELFRVHNLPTPAYYVGRSNDGESALRNHGDFGYPCIVKPTAEGSSIGVTVCRDHHEFVAGWETASAFGDDMLVERFIEGMEITVAVVGDRALGAIEVARTAAYDFAQKHQGNQERLFTPPRITPERYRAVLRTALRAHQALGCSGATTVDMIVTASGNEFVLEVNTLPGMADNALLPRIAKAAGIGFAELCEMMVLGADLGTTSKPTDRRVVNREYHGDERRIEVSDAH